MLPVNQWIFRIKTYCWRNPGAPFIIGFQVSLVVCAGLLINGSSVLAEGVATVAYFFLVFGVLFQLISYLVQQRKIRST